MKILAIESSAGPASCAVTEDGRLLAQAFVHTGLTHSQTLIPMADSLLKSAGLSLSEIDRLAVAAGPGSFTGVRIGVAAVKGLAFARNIPCVPVSTLAAMARLLQEFPFEGSVCAAMDARCRQVYTALFSCGGGTVSRLTPDEALSLDELQSRLLKADQPIFLVGDGAELCYNTFKGQVPRLVLAPPHLRYQQAAGVALEAAEGETVSAESLRPAYLRLPQAERELRTRQGSLAGKR